MVKCETKVSCDKNLLPNYNFLEAKTYFLNKAIKQNGKAMACILEKTRLIYAALSNTLLWLVAVFHGCFILLIF